MRKKEAASKFWNVREIGGKHFFSRMSERKARKHSKKIEIQNVIPSIRNKAKFAGGFW